MNDPTFQKAFEIRRDVRSLQDESGMVLLDLSAGTYFSLNRVGASIWQEIVAGGTHQALIDAVCQRFHISSEKAADDVAIFLTDLRAKGLIHGHV